jgi:hypothetical protein
VTVRSGPDVVRRMMQSRNPARLAPAEAGSWIVVDGVAAGGTARGGLATHSHADVRATRNRAAGDGV